MKYFLLFSILGFVAISGVFAHDCAHRNYGHGSTVCVCNATYCDDIAPIVKTPHGIATSIVTSADGDRFARKQLHFSKTRPHVAPTVTVTIDPHTKYQVIKGFGGAMTDAAGINIAHLPKDLQKRLIMDYYSKDGIEYSLGRVPIGGSDFSTRPYTYDDHANDESLSKFALESEDLKYKIPYIKMAQEVSPHKIYWFGSPWSSPAWMKKNNELNHGGLLKGHPGEKYYKMFAKYLVRFIEEYAKHQITIRGLTIENEPGAGFNPRYPWNSLGFNKTLQRDFIKLDLGPFLHDKNYSKDKLDLMIFDDQLPYVLDWSKTILDDINAAKYVSGIAFHWYENYKAHFQDLDEIHSKHKDIFLLATEACEEWHGKPQHVYLGAWQTFNRYSEDIIRDLNHWTSGWTDWNLVLDEKGGPNWVGNYVDAPIIVNGTSKEYYKQPFFYAMGHFSKVLVPGSVRIRHESNHKEALLTAFIRPDNARTLTVLNKEKHAIIVQLHDPNSGYLDVTVKAESMETLIWY